MHRTCAKQPVMSCDSTNGHTLDCLLTHADRCRNDEEPIEGPVQGGSDDDDFEGGQPDTALLDNESEDDSTGAALGERLAGARLSGGGRAGRTSGAQHSGSELEDDDVDMDE